MSATEPLPAGPPPAPSDQAVDGSARSGPPLPQLVEELRDLVVAYVRQETVVPLKSLGRYVLWGVVGSLLLGLGVLFLGVGLLRLLQAETDTTFTGNWSWAPYGIMFVVLILGAAATWKLRGAVRRPD